MPPHARVALAIRDVALDASSAVVEWTLSEGEWRYLNPAPFRLAYRWQSGKPLVFDGSRRYVLEQTSAAAFLSVAVPALCLYNDVVEIDTPFPLNDADVQYWQSLPERFDLRGRVVLRNTGDRSRLEYSSFRQRPDRVGLFYGGGVESNAALDRLLDRAPLLLVVDGPGWMNNDTSANITPKRDLENRLCESFQLEMVHAETNAREVSGLPEPLLHHLCSGGLFYWVAAAVGLQCGLGQFQIAQELEYTLIRDHWDLSLTPGQMYRAWHPECPMVAPILGWESKFELLRGLKDSPLLQYVYACVHNGQERWCGVCPKCYRISLSCQRLGIPLEAIGMAAPATGSSEGSQLRRLYWWTTDHLCPVPGEPKPAPWAVPLTEVVLSDVFALGLYECASGQVAKDGDTLIFTPAWDGRAELRFERLRLNGHDRFTCVIEPRADAPWRLELAVTNPDGTAETIWSEEVSGVSPINVTQDFPERFGLHALTLTVRPSRGARPQTATSTSSELPPPPVWRLPTLSRPLA